VGSEESANRNTDLASGMFYEKTVKELEKRLPRAFGDNKARIKSRIMVLKNNLWLCQSWGKPKPYNEIGDKPGIRNIARQIDVVV